MFWNVQRLTLRKRANGFYSYLLSRKGKFEEALKYLKIEMRIVDSLTMDHAFYYGYYNYLLGNEIEADKGMRKVLQLIETVEEKHRILKEMQTGKNDEKSMEFWNRLKEGLEAKSFK